MLTTPEDHLTALRESLVEKRRGHAQRYSKGGVSAVTVAAMVRLTDIQESIEAIDRALADERGSGTKLGVINAGDD